MKRRLICLLMTATLLLVMIPVLPLQANAASAMVSSDQLITVIKKIEGFNATPYWDVNHWAVGYGTKCPSDKLEQYKAYGIPIKDAEALLKKELQETETDLNNFAAKHSLTWSQHQFDALVSFTYNCGSGWMYETTGYFNTAVREGFKGSAFIYAICLFGSTNGQYVLMNRRMCEANMYLNGVYKAYNDGGVTYPDNYRWVFLEGNGADVRYRVCAFDANEGVPVTVMFEDIPTGKDSSGNTFVYSLAGWYTKNGTKVEKLDTTLTRNQVLQAKWKDANGKELPNKSEFPKNGAVNASAVNYRTEPKISSSTLAGQMNKGDRVKITEEYYDGSMWWGKMSSGYWISLSYVTYDEESDTETDTYPLTGVVNTANVNYRTEPTVSSSTLVGQLNKGDRVTITQSKHDGTRWWGKMSNGYWICLDYVTYDKDVVTSIKLLEMPYKTTYKKDEEALDLNGSVLEIRYGDGSVYAKTLTRDMVSGFTNTKSGEVTVKVSYKGKSTSFKVTVVGKEATVTFKNWDGTVISQKSYEYGSTVTAPATPQRPADESYTYTFAGWDKPIVPVNGNAVYTATYTTAQIYYTVTFKNWDGTVLHTAKYTYGQEVTAPQVPPRAGEEDWYYNFCGWDKSVVPCAGAAVYTAVFNRVNAAADINGDQCVNNEDVVYLLWHTLFPDDYPLTVNGDFTADAEVTNDDVVYLLWHTLFPDDYPLTTD